MKKIGLLILIILIFGVFGCQQQKPMDEQTDETVQTGEIESSDKPDVSAGSMSAPTIASANDFNGKYEGTTEIETCLYNFKIDVNGSAVSGTAGGESEVDCTMTLTGTVDNKGNMDGQATGIDTYTAKGQTFIWYYDGEFSGTLNKDGGDISVTLNATGHECPPNIPCEDISKDVDAVLKKV
jgi:hypothetical protein